MGEAIADRQRAVEAWSCTCDYGDCIRCDELYYLRLDEQAGHTHTAVLEWVALPSGEKALIGGSYGG